MRTILASTFVALIVGATLVAAAAWVVAVTYGVKAIRQTRRGVKPWSRATFWNPANLVMRPELLTADGQRYRRSCLRAIVVFAVSVAIPFLVGAITAALK